MQSRLRFLMNNIQNYTLGNLLLHPWPFEICDPATPHTSFFFLGLHRRPQAQSAGVKDFDLRGAVVDFKTKVSAWASGDKGGLTREVEMSLPSYSPHDQMILRVDLMGSHGRWTRPCLTAFTTWAHGVGFEGKGLSTSRVSPPGPLSISYGHVRCLKAWPFPPPV